MNRRIEEKKKMGQFRRYFTLFRIFMSGGYARAEYLEKKQYFKSRREYYYL